MRARWSTCAGLLLVVLAATAGCGDDGGGGLPPPASPPPAAGSPAAPVDPEHQEILDVYYGAVAAQVTAQRAGDRDHPELDLYFGGGTPALRDVRFGIDRQEIEGTYYEGDLAVVSAVVTTLELTEDPATASITACLDDTDYRLVSREDGSPVPGTQAGGRYTVTATALLHEPDDRWYIVENIAHWDEPC